MLRWPPVGLNQEDDEPDPPVVGEFIVRASATVNGAASYQASDSNGSVDQRENVNGTITGTTRYVVQLIGDERLSGDELAASSTATVGGEGSMLVKIKDGTLRGAWSFVASPDFDPTASAATGVLDTGSDYCSGGIDFPPITSTGDSEWGVARNAAYEAFRKANGFTFDIPTGTNEWSLTQSRSGTYQEMFHGGSAEGSAQCTVTVTFIPTGLPQWEAILEPITVDRSAYSQWIPKGGRGEDEPGSYLGARVYLRAVDGSAATPPEAKFTFFLEDVSREPGICMNFPPRSEPAVAPYDLRFLDNDELTVAEQGQQAETKDLVREAGVAVACYDYGAHGKLKVVVQTVTGLTLVARVEQPVGYFLSIPIDDNQNHVADAWEKDMEVFDQGLDAKWEGTLDPAYQGQALEGDGISLFEKYRGFMVLMPDGEEAHERPSPWFKYLFIRNPDRLLREVFRSEDGFAESYPSASKCEVRYISSTGWTGPGAFKDKRRIVNFNYSEDKHAVDQHALYLTVNPSKNPFFSTEWAKLGKAPDSGKAAEATQAFGVTYPDRSAPSAFLDHWRPASVFQVEIFAANITNRVFQTVRYHTYADCPAPCDATSLDAWTSAYIAAFPFSFRTKYTIAFCATATHELGHATGLNHHDPSDSDPKKAGLANCLMRYYGPAEFSRNVGDRFELMARGHNPSFYCRESFDCWGQLQVTDNPAATRGAANAVARDTHAPRIARMSPFTPTSPVETRLQVSADLDWQEMIEGDPLRLWVRLHGVTGAVKPNWTEGLTVTLRRLSGVSPPEVTLGPARWPAFLQADPFDFELLSVSNVTRIREFLVPPDAAGLEAGRYALEIAWNGTPFAPALLLPTNGVVGVPTVEFEVRPATNAVLQALGRRHLAWYHYLVGNLTAVLSQARDAHQLDPGGSDPLAIQSEMILAEAAAAKGEPLEGALVLDRLRRQLPSANTSAAELVIERFGLLSPRLRLAEAPASQGPRWILSGVPGQTYVLQRSGDLKHWSSISTNTPATNDFALPEVQATGGAPQFYRVLWVPQ
ncbi:MAG: hypothetical protein JNK85_14340 [Verrucomicrobiales bacterium]|nr:hypothetical protein [Verrucomicrobiales bacterium]